MRSQLHYQKENTTYDTLAQVEHMTVSDSVCKEFFIINHLYVLSGSNLYSIYTIDDMEEKYFIHDSHNRLTKLEEIRKTRLCLPYSLRSRKRTFYSWLSFKISFYETIKGNFYIKTR